MKIKFLKDYRYPGGGYSNKGDVQTFEDTEFVKWAIGNGFAEEVKESGWWKPGNGGRYYYVNDDGEIIEKPWLPFGSPTDEKRFIMGNCFRSNVAAERWRDYLKAIATVRQDEGVLTPEEVMHAADAGTTIGRVVVNDRTRDLVAGYSNLYITSQSVGAIYFDTCEHAQDSLDKHPDEWKIIANYDWSRE